MLLKFRTTPSLGVKSRPSAKLLVLSFKSISSTSAAQTTQVPKCITMGCRYLSRRYRCPVSPQSNQNLFNVPRRQPVQSSNSLTLPLAFLAVAFDPSVGTWSALCTISLNFAMWATSAFFAHVPQLVAWTTSALSAVLLQLAMWTSCTFCAALPDVAMRTSCAHSAIFLELAMRTMQVKIKQRGIKFM